MSDIDALVHRVRRSVPIVSVSGVLALILSVVALVYSSTVADQREADRQQTEQEACERGNAFRADVRDLADTTASGFTELADIIVGDEERTPEEQAAIDRARALYEERVVDPIEALASDGGTLADRECP